MKKVLFLLMLLFSTKSYSVEIYEGQNCLTYVFIVKIVEKMKTERISKKEAIEAIKKSKNSPEIKNVFYENIELIYNIDTGNAYSNSLLKQCVNKGKIKFEEV